MYSPTPDLTLETESKIQLFFLTLAIPKPIIIKRSENAIFTVKGSERNHTPIKVPTSGTI